MSLPPPGFPSKDAFATAAADLLGIEGQLSRVERDMLAFVAGHDEMLRKMADGTSVREQRRDHLLRKARPFVEDFGERLTLHRFTSEARVRPQDIDDAFGSWSAMREALGLRRRALIGRTAPDADALIEVGRAMATEGLNPTVREFCDRAGVSEPTFRERFRFWADFAARCGLPPSPRRAKQHASAALLADLASVWRRAGGPTERFPTRQAYDRDGTYSAQTIHARFGSWADARRLCEAVLEGSPPPAQLGAFADDVRAARAAAAFGRH